MPPDIPGLASRYFEAPEGRLHVYHAGETGSPVLLLSGAGADSALLSWRHLIPVLAESHRYLPWTGPSRVAAAPGPVRPITYACCVA